jgi:hypothetical protein
VSESKELDERVDDAIDEFNKFRKKLDDSLTLENRRFAERYLNREMEIWARFRTIEAIPTDFCAIYQRWAPGILTDIFGKSFIDPLADVGGERAANDDFTKSGYYNNQEPMLVDNVKLVENPEIIVSSLVWLQRSDKAFNLRADSLYFSRSFGCVFGSTLAKREICGSSRFRPIRFDELADKMIESAPQIVNGVASDRGDVAGNGGAKITPMDFCAGIFIYLHPDLIWVGGDKTLNATFELSDVMFGPLNFVPDTG